jgi:hypothetical protein
MKKGVFITAGLLITIIMTYPVSAVLAETWEPPEPDSEDFDWIQLTSGEWLKGSIKYLRQNKLEFDSDKMGIVTFPWRDIAVVRSSRSNICLFEDGTEVSGTLMIDIGKVIVDGRSFNRSQLRTIIPGEPTELSYWSSRASLSLSAVYGNTDQTTTTGYFEVTRDDATNIIFLSYTGNYGKLDGVKTIDNHRILSSYFRDVSNRVFLVIPSFEFYMDPFKNIDTRYNIVGGAGYRFVDNPITLWTASLSVGWRKTTYDSVMEGVDQSDDVTNFMFATRWDQELTADTDLLVSYNFQISFEDSADRLHHFDTLFSTEIGGPFNLDITFAWDRVNQPVPYEDGTVPEKDDYRTGIGLSIDF